MSTSSMFSSTPSSPQYNPIGPVMNCPFCQKSVVVKSKRVGLKDHMRLNHPAEYNNQNRACAVGVTEAMEKSAESVGSTLRNHTLVMSPTCPRCNESILVSNCSDFGLHVLACTQQLNLVSDIHTASKIVMTQQGGGAPHVLPSVLQQVRSLPQSRLANLYPDAEEVDSAHVAINGTLVSPVPPKASVFLPTHPVTPVPVRVPKRVVFNPNPL